MSDTSDEKALQQLILSLAVRVDHVVRSSQIYPDDHPALDAALLTCCEQIGHAVAGRGQVAFAPAGRRFVVQGVAVPAPRSLRGPLDGLQKWLNDRGCGGMELRASVGASSLMRTIRIIDGQPKDGSAEPDRINLQLEEVGLRAIRVSPPRRDQADDREDASLQTLRLYLQGVRAVQRLHERGASPAVLIELSQLADAFVDLCEEAPLRALALTQARRMVPYALRHPVHTSLLCVLMGQRFGAPRPVLRELAICGLLADAGKADLPPALRRVPTALSPSDRLERDRHPLHAVGQLLGLPELHDRLRRRLVVVFEQELGDDLGGSPQVIRWGHRHPVSRLVGLCSAWDDRRAAAGPLDSDPGPLLQAMRAEEADVHSELLIDHLRDLITRAQVVEPPRSPSECADDAAAP